MLSFRVVCVFVSGEVDQRDLEKIENDPLYVARFIRHNRGNIDNALDHMVCCMYSTLYVHEVGPL